MKISPEQSKQLIRNLMRLHRAFAARSPITMSRWRAFTTKSGRTGALGADGRKVYGKEAERVLRQTDKQAAAEEEGQSRQSAEGEVKGRMKAAMADPVVMKEWKKLDAETLIQIAQTKGDNPESAFHREMANRLLAEKSNRQGPMRSSDRGHEGTQGPADHEKAARVAKANAKTEILRMTKGLSREEMLTSLKENPDPSKYFKTDMPGTMMVPVAKMKAIRAREKGIQNALPFMYAASQGKGKLGKREPLKVISSREGFKVYDGNSTFAIAELAGWDELPVQFVGDDGEPLGINQNDLKAHDLPRIDMPQLSGEGQRQFLDAMRKKGVEITEEQVSPADFQGTQAEFNLGMVAGIANDIKNGKMEHNPVLATSDGYILDGHHRWRAHHAAGEKLPVIKLGMTAGEAIDAMHRFPQTERRTIGDTLVGKASGFGPKMADYLHSSLHPIMRDALDPSDFRRPIDKPQPMQSESEVIESAGQNLQDYREIVDFGMGVSKTIGAKAVFAGDPGAFENLVSEVKSGELKGPFVLVAPLKTASKKGLARAREKVETKYDGDWSRLRDVVRGTIAVDKFDEIPQVMKALRKHAREKGWRIATRPEDRFSNPTSAGYRDMQLFIESPDGLQAEVQINTKSMWLAKETDGHKLFERARSLRAEMKRSGSTPELKQRVEQLDKQMSEIYAKAWQAAGGNEALSSSRPQPLA